MSSSRPNQQPFGDQEHSPMDERMKRDKDEQTELICQLRRFKNYVRLRIEEINTQGRYFEQMEDLLQAKEMIENPEIFETLSLKNTKEQLYQLCRKHPIKGAFVQDKVQHRNETRVQNISEFATDFGFVPPCLPKSSNINEDHAPEVIFERRNERNITLTQDPTTTFVTDFNHVPELVEAIQVSTNSNTTSLDRDGSGTQSDPDSPIIIEYNHGIQEEISTEENLSFSSNERERVRSRGESNPGRHSDQTSSHLQRRVSMEASDSIRNGNPNYSVSRSVCSETGTNGMRDENEPGFLSWFTRRDKTHTRPPPRDEERRRSRSRRDSNDRRQSRSRSRDRDRRSRHSRGLQRSTSRSPSTDRNASRNSKNNAESPDLDKRSSPLCESNPTSVKDLELKMQQQIQKQELQIQELKAIVLLQGKNSSSIHSGDTNQMNQTGFSSAPQNTILSPPAVAPDLFHGTPSHSAQSTPQGLFRPPLDRMHPAPPLMYPNINIGMNSAAQIPRNHYPQPQPDHIITNIPPDPNFLPNSTNNMYGQQQYQFVPQPAYNQNHLGPPLQGQHILPFPDPNFNRIGVPQNPRYSNGASPRRFVIPNTSNTNAGYPPNGMQGIYNSNNFVLPRPPPSATATSQNYNTHHPVNLNNAYRMNHNCLPNNQPNINHYPQNQASNFPPDHNRIMQTQGPLLPTPTPTYGVYRQQIGKPILHRPPNSENHKRPLQRPYQNNADPRINKRNQTQQPIQGQSEFSGNSLTPSVSNSIPHLDSSLNQVPQTSAINKAAVTLQNPDNSTTTHSGSLSPPADSVPGNDLEVLLNRSKHKPVAIKPPKPKAPLAECHVEPHPQGREQSRLRQESSEEGISKSNRSNLASQIRTNSNITTPQPPIHTPTSLGVRRPSGQSTSKNIPSSSETSVNQANNAELNRKLQNTMDILKSYPLPKKGSALKKLKVTCIKAGIITPTNPAASKNQKNDKANPNSEPISMRRNIAVKSSSKKRSIAEQLALSHPVCPRPNRPQKLNKTPVVPANPVENESGDDEEEIGVKKRKRVLPLPEESESENEAESVPIKLIPENERFCQDGFIAGPKNVKLLLHKLPIFYTPDKDYTLSHMWEKQFELICHSRVKAQRKTSKSKIAYSEAELQRIRREQENNPQPHPYHLRSLNSNYINVQEPLPSTSGSRHTNSDLKIRSEFERKLRETLTKHIIEREPKRIVKKEVDLDDDPHHQNE